MGERKHIAYLDYLRLFAAAGVVYMHTAAMPLRNGVTLGWHAMNLVTSLAFTAVPLFFMISGFLLLSDEKTLQSGILLRRRLPRLVIPLAVWTVIAVAWNCVSARTAAVSYWGRQLLGALYAPVLAPYWFMYTLIAIYILSPLLCGGIHVLGKSGKRYILVLIALVSLKSMVKAFLPDAAASYVNLDILAKLQSLGGYLLIFLLGYCLGTMEKKIPNALLITVAAAVYGVIVIGTWQRTVRHGWYDAAFQDQSAGFEVILAGCLFLLAKQNLNRECVWLRRIPAVPLLLPVYFMHAVVLNMFYVVGINPMRFPATVGCTVLNLVICYLSLKTAATIRPLCYAVTGMTYEKACVSCNWVYTARRLRGEAKKDERAGGA